jgi:hypothetical protein
MGFYQGGSMNQFVYLVHLEYRDHGPLPANVSRLRPRTPSEKAAQLPAQLQRYLPDPQVRISGERIRNDPEVVRVTVATNLDEAVADAAFVRFIRDCNEAFPARTLRDRLDEATRRHDPQRAFDSG